MKSIWQALTRTKAAPPGWSTLVHEPFTGAWQQNQSLSREDMLAFHAVFACVTLIASDISKLGLRLHERDSNGVWVARPALPGSKLLATPNAYQTTGQFIESWLISKQARGNAYILKERARGRVTGLHVLHPDRVRPLVSDQGVVYYEISDDRLAGVDEMRVVLGADDIIHDRFNCLYHPLVGMSALYAAALSVSQGRQIQSNSSAFFGNNSMPGGVLTVPGSISEESARALKEQWHENHHGGSSGKLAVLTDGMKYEPIAMTASDSQLLEQLRWTAEVVCSVFHVPPYKIGVGAMPSYNNIQALNQEYYSQCLQRLIKDVQTLLNVGLSVGESQGFRFDLDALLMMDSQGQIEVLTKGVGAGVFEPDYARRKFNLPPTEGGATPYLQQQNYSLAALAKRDALDDPFSRSAPTDTLADDLAALEQGASA